MPVRDWVEIANLQLLSKHTVTILAAGLSFFLITGAFRKFVGPGFLHNLIVSLDEGILFILVLWFTYQMLLVLWKTRLKLPKGNELISLVA